MIRSNNTGSLTEPLAVAHSLLTQDTKEHVPVLSVLVGGADTGCDQL